MAETALNAIVTVGGLLLALVVSAHHLYHIFRQEKNLLHGCLSGYYRVLAAYVAVSGLVTVAFFGTALFPAQLAELLGGKVLVHTAFLGLTLVWLGTANWIFSSVNTLSESYFAEGDGDGS